MTRIAPSKRTRRKSTESALPLPPGIRLTQAAQDDWRRLLTALPLNTGPRLLFILVDSPFLRTALLDYIRQMLADRDMAPALLDLAQPTHKPLNELLSQAAAFPTMRFYFATGLERSLLSSEHRINAATEMNMQRDVIHRRLSAPLVLWTNNEAFTFLARQAPDFVAWHGGVFIFEPDLMAAPTAVTPLSGNVMTLMITDIAGSTELKGLMTGVTDAERDAAYRRQIQEPCAQVILSLVKKFRGEQNNFRGDGYLFLFRDPSAAVRCALAIQERMRKKRIGTPKGHLKIKVGIHTGNTGENTGQLVSMHADKVARIADAAKGDEVLISRETYGLIADTLRSVGYSRKGVPDLKGLGPATLYSVFTATQDPIAAAEAAYRQHLGDNFGMLKLYSTRDVPFAVELERIFVTLTAVIRQSESDLEIVHGPAAASPWQSAIPTLPEGAVDLGLTLGVLRATPVPPSARILSVAGALQEHAFLVILGAPGAGKTTLLKYLTLTFARYQAQDRLALKEERLPLFVTLRDYNRFLDNLAAKGHLLNVTPDHLPQFLQQYYTTGYPHLILPPNFFAEALSQKRCVVLCDGLDEIADESKRRRVAESIEQCRRDFPDNRWVITSRPRGYEIVKSFLDATAGVCSIRDFDDRDIDAFAHNWYTAVTIGQEGDTPTARDHARQYADNLLKAIGSQGINSLAGNPLLLSILALVHKRGVGLPQRRADLYDECTEFLLGFWDEIRSGEAGRELAELGGLRRPDKRSLLAPLALWMHERGADGVEIARKDLEQQLASSIRDCFGDQEGRARARSRQFVNLMVDRAGLLNEKEADVFTFSHLTFQEYLAACAIADREDYCAYTVSRLHQPWWQEVILLESGHLSIPQSRRSRELTGKLLQAIRNAGSPLEDILKRDLLLAFRCLCDVGQLGVDPKIRQELLTEILTLWESTRWIPQRQEIEKLFAYAASTYLGVDISQYLLDKMVKLDGTTQNARNALQRLRLSKTTLDVLLPRLLGWLQDNNDSRCLAALMALPAIGKSAAYQELFDRLLELTDDNKSEVVRWLAIIALSAISESTAHSQVTGRLLELTHDVNSEDVREVAIYALGSITMPATPGQVLEQLMKLTDDNNPSRIRRASIQALALACQQSPTPEVLRRLLDLTGDTQSNEIRQATISALGSIGKATGISDVVERLLKLTNDSDAGVRKKAIEALQTVGGASPKVSGRLLELTAKDRDGQDRVAAVRALGASYAEAATPEVPARMLELTFDADTEVREIAIKALSSSSPMAVTSTMLERLHKLMDDPDHDTRGAAIQALAKIGPSAATPTVIVQLEKIMKDSREIGLFAAIALRRMMEGTFDTSIMESLLRFWKERIDSDGTCVYQYRNTVVRDCAYSELRALVAWPDRYARGRKNHCEATSVDPHRA